MSVLSLDTYAQAAGLGNQIWRLIIDNWGNTGPAGADSTSTQYTVNPIGSVYSAVIGPDSTVDRAVVAFSPVTYQGALVFQPIPAVMPNFMQVVSVDRPSGQLPGNIIVRNEQSNQFSGSYRPVGAAINASFGTSIVAPGVWETPTLQMDFYLKPPIEPLPIKRNPLFRSMLAGFNGNPPIVAGAGETLIRVFPISGRKRIHWQCRGEFDIVATTRMGIVNGGPVATSTFEEITVGTGAISGPAGTVSAITSDLPGTYATLYVTCTAGVTPQLVGHFLAYD